MKAKRLLDSSNSKDGHPQAFYCDIHPQEEIERVCCLTNCKRKPLLCWQCLLDDKEHSENHRQYFLKLPDFFKKFLDEYEEMNKKNKLQEIPPDLNIIIEDEAKNIEEYENICEHQKLNIEEEFISLQKDFETTCAKAVESLKESVDKKCMTYKQNYSTIKAKIEEHYGLSKSLNQQIILEEMNTQKENSSLSEYFLNLKQTLLPKVPLLKDPSFTSVLTRFSKMNEKCAEIEESSKIKKTKTDALKIFEKNIQELQNDLFSHFKLDFRNSEENLTSILKRTAQTTSKAPLASKNNNMLTTIQLQESSFPMSMPKSEPSKVSLILRKTIKTSHSKPINAIKVINEELIATASKDRKIKVWKIYSKECLFTLEGHKDNVCCLGVLNKPKKLFPFLISGGGNFDSSLIIWDLESRKQKVNLIGHQSSITTLVSLKDNKTIISGSYDNNIIVWDSDENIARFVLRKHSAMVSSLKLLKDGDMIASASWDKTIALWRISYDEENNFCKCDFMYSILENFAILTLGNSLLEPNRLIYAGTNKKFYVYNVENKEKEMEFEGSHFGVNELAVIESNFLEAMENFLVIGLSNNDSCLRIWEGKDCQQVYWLKDSENAWLNNLNTGPKIEVFSNFENKIQVALMNNSSENNFAINIYDFIIE